ncbi:ATP-binding protein [Streptomyces sp. NBC_00433]
MLLRFRVTNHRSIRDTVELVLAKSSFEGIRPVDGNWKSVTNRVVGIFGSNASGKTNLLNAMSFAINAINSSANWDDRENFPFRPFILDGRSASETSAYEFDFIASGTRYIYGFESNSAGVQSEWLNSFPEGRKRVLFERNDSTVDGITFGRTLKGENMRIARRMGAMNLYISLAAKSGHRELGRVQHYLTKHIEYAAYSESQQQNRIQAIKGWMETDKVRQRAGSLLKFADLGISRLSVEDVPMDEENLRIIASVAKAVADSVPGANNTKSADELAEEIAERQRLHIKFWHTGDGTKDEYVLEIENESSGTVAWLSLALPAMRAIDNGSIFVVDEIDASLHPRLTSAFISLFKDPEINLLGAQLIFASHDTSLMGHLGGGALEKEDVWFAEKAADGASEYYPLTDFPVKADHNLERRYLSGRYGAVPAVSWEDLRASLVAGVHE